MSKAVLLSTRPQWCEKMACGDKTDEIRKNAPKIEGAFKCYIYETTGMWDFPILRYLGLAEMLHKLMAGKGKVIGEFVCDRIRPITAENSKEIERTSFVSIKEMWKYAQPKSLYDLKAWHISQLVIHDKPKDLNEFMRPYGSIIKAFDSPHIQRAPQSWCYVEELT